MTPVLFNEELQAVNELNRAWFAANPDRILYLRKSYEVERVAFNRQGLQDVWAITLHAGDNRYETVYHTDPDDYWDSGAIDPSDDMAIAVLWEMLDHQRVAQGKPPSDYSLNDLLYLKALKVSSVVGRKRRH